MVTALQMFSLDAVNASEFLEVYKGVVPPGEFAGMLDELTSGDGPIVNAYSTNMYGLRQDQTGTTHAAVILAEPMNKRHMPHFHMKGRHAKCLCHS